MPSRFKEDLDAIADGIWRRKRAGQPRIERAKGAAPKPPKVTYEAKDGRACEELPQRHVD